MAGLLAPDYEEFARARLRDYSLTLDLGSGCSHSSCSFCGITTVGATPVVRSDNGLIFQSRRFRRACRSYRLRQEFITPSTPEQNGIIERFFRSLKEECVWLRNFRCLEEARRHVRRWIEWYNALRPHQSLGYRSPIEYRAQQLAAVA